MGETVTVSKDCYQELFDDSVFLGFLRGAGVDNWDGYSFAVEEYNKYKEQNRESK